MSYVSWAIAAIIYVAILYALVRPNSKGAGLVMVISSTFTDLVRGVSGQTYDQKTKTWSPAK